MNPSMPTEDDTVPLLTPALAPPRAYPSSSSIPRPLLPDAHTAVTVEHEVCLTWRDLSCVVERHTKGPSSHVAFHGVAGWVRGGELLAILGPRGSGKQTLLEVLACRQGVSRVGGACLLNGVPCDDEALRRWGQYVPLVDTLLQSATVEETIRFAVRLHAHAAPSSLSSSSGRTGVEETVDALLSLLCLWDARHTRVDRLLASPNNGGRREAKLCAVAVALAANPSLLFVEDPIAGMDALCAMSVIASLCAVAASGVAVVITASQPAAGVFRLLDKVLLLNSEGEQAYFGAADGAVEHFASLGVHPSSNSSGGMDGNPADFLVGSVGTANEILQEQVRRIAGATTASHLLPPPTQGRDIASGFGATRLAEVLQQVEDLEAACLPLADPPPCRACLDGVGRPITQLYTVTGRTLVSLSRGSASCWVSILQLLLFVLLVGALYYQLGLAQASLPRRVVVLFLVATYTTYFANTSLETLAAEDSAVHTRERRSGMYSISVYYMGVVLPHAFFIVLLSTVFNAAVYGVVGLQANLQSFLVYCLLCSLVSLNSCAVRILVSTLASPRRCALAAWLTSLLLALYLIPAGRILLHLERLPLCFSWLESVSFLHYTFAAMVSNELEGLVLNCTGHNESSSVCFATGQQYANHEGFYREDMWSFTLHSGIHAFCYLCAAYILLCFSQIRWRKKALLTRVV